MLQTQVPSNVNIYSMVWHMKSQSRKEFAEKVFSTIASFYGIEYNDLVYLKYRGKEMEKARHLAWKIVFDSNTKYTYDGFAKKFGGYHHTTILEGIRSISNLISKEEDLRKNYYELCEKLGVVPVIESKKKRSKKVLEV